jgi:hypothetical protein
MHVVDGSLAWLLLGCAALGVCHELDLRAADRTESGQLCAVLRVLDRRTGRNVLHCNRFDGLENGTAWPSAAPAPQHSLSSRSLVPLRHCQVLLNLSFTMYICLCALYPWVRMGVSGALGTVKMDLSGYIQFRVNPISKPSLTCLILNPSLGSGRSQTSKKLQVLLAEKGLAKAPLDPSKNGIGEDSSDQPPAVLHIGGVHQPSGYGFIVSPKSPYVQQPAATVYVNGAYTQILAQPMPYHQPPQAQPQPQASVLMAPAFDGVGYEDVAALRRAILSGPDPAQGSVSVSTGYVPPSLPAAPVQPPPQSQPTQYMPPQQMSQPQLQQSVAEASTAPVASVSSDVGSAQPNPPPQM